MEVDRDTAHAAKTLKEMHERNEIAGRPAGTFTAVATSTRLASRTLRKAVR